MKVSYEKNMRDRAKSEKKWLVTVSVSGKHLGDDSCTVQALVDMTTAKKIAKVGVDLLKPKSEPPQGGTGATTSDSKKS